MEIAQLIRLFDRLRPRSLPGTLHRLAVGVRTAIWAYNPLVLVGHLVQEGGKRLATVLT